MMMNCQLCFLQISVIAWSIAFVNALSANTIASQILSQLTGPLLHSEQWGVSASVWNASTNRFDTLVEFNPDQHFVPASVTKLLASSAVLRSAGAAFAFNTTFKLLASGTLCINAAGDPSIAYDDLINVAKSLAPAAVQHVAFVDPFRRLPSFPDSWEVGDSVETYGAAPSALILNENTLSLAVSGAASQGSPAKLALSNALDAALLPDEFQNEVVTDSAASANGADVSADAVPFRRGIVLSGAIRPGDSRNFSLAVPRPNRRFARAIGTAFGLAKDEPSRVDSCAGIALGEQSIVSQSLIDLITHTLLVSDNLYAEMFLRYFAHNATSLGSALTAVLATLPPSVTAGVGRYVDGSGLSRYNAISPAAFNALMAHIMTAWPAADSAAFVRALPTAGVSGTLRNRFIGTPAQYCTHAKTGSMTGVNSLVGVITRAPAPLITFAIIVNNGVRNVKPDMDNMVNLMAQLN
jgi:D-alanyl-D-alanine carboxypeptidase/D-alanyl-D-alanine-endopeptidase (penicillin-binding protein 4)